ncbi:MAG: YdeI/OmpD-associated family protein [Candidatus Taylorbacteria bacterium]
MHTMPTDLRKALTSSPAAQSAWDDITPLARNEWICWVVSVKKEETRKDHVRRAIEELVGGKRRPCCWAGCSHRSK